MPITRQLDARGIFALILLTLACAVCRAEDKTFPLQADDRIALVGNSLAERMRLYGHLETQIHLRFPAQRLRIRDFGWPTDEVGRQ